MLTTNMTPVLHLPRGADTYGAALEGLVRLNQAIMERLDLPRLLNSGVVYRRDRDEVWKRADEVLHDGWGDCEDLAAWLAAELRHRRIDPRATAIVYQSGPGRWHAIVKKSNGITIDPSRILIDRRRHRMRDYIGDDPVKTTEISLTVDPKPGGGFVATLRIPLDLGRAIFMQRAAASPDGAATKALKSGAMRMLDNPAVAALMPGPAKLALGLAADPKAREVAGKVLGTIGGKLGKFF